MAAITYAPGLGIHVEGLGQQVLVEPLHKDGVYPIVASLSNEIPPVLEPNGYQLSQLVAQPQGQIHHEKVLGFHLMKPTAWHLLYGAEKSNSVKEPCCATSAIGPVRRLKGLPC